MPKDKKVKCPRCGAHECQRLCSAGCHAPEHTYNCEACGGFHVVGDADRDMYAYEQTATIAAVAEFLSQTPHHLVLEVKEALCMRITEIGHHAPKQTRQRWAIELILLNRHLRERAFRLNRWERTVLGHQN